MLSRILLRFRSMTTRQRAVLLVAMSIPALVVLSLLIGTALNAAPVGAAVALALILAGTGAAAAYFFQHRRFAKRATAEAAPIMAVTAVGKRPSRAVVDRDEHLLANSDTAQRLAWLYQYEQAPPQIMRGHGAASRTLPARDFFALRATNWRFDWHSLRQVLSAPTLKPALAEQLLGPVEGNAAITLARLLLAQNLETTDTQCALRLLSIACAEVTRLQVPNREVALQLLLHLADEIDSDEVASTSSALLAHMRGGDYPARFLQLDLLNPWRTHQPGVTEEIWLAAVNGMFTRSGLEHISLLTDGATPFDRLHAESNVAVSDGPLVSVIMSCYNPGPALLTAVRSMISQTWQSWELLITDDASPIDPTRLLEQVAAMDSRIRVIRNAVNAGTYVRRNEAVDIANGEFITMQDSDDWVHPRRLELQMRHLIADPSLLANASQSVRMSEDLMFVQPRGTTVRIAESSLLFRKDPVLANIGYFDSIRKAADSEFRLRLESFTGGEVPVVDVEAPLSLVRFDRSSLSASDLGDGWMHPARIAYRGAQAQWRRERQSAGLPLSLPFPLLQRPFPVHPHLSGGIAPEYDLDVLFVLDTTGRGRSQDVVLAVVQEVGRLRRAGRTVGVRRAIAIGETRALESTHGDLQALINAGEVVEVLAVDHATTELLVVRHAECLLGLGEGEQPVVARDSIVVGGRGAVPRSYCNRGLANLGLEDTSVSWISRSRWAEQLDSLCAGSTSSDTVST